MIQTIIELEEKNRILWHFKTLKGFLYGNRGEQPISDDLIMKRLEEFKNYIS